MSSTNYGAMGAALYDPKQFVLKALKKIILNNRNSEKFYEQGDNEGIVGRMINSIHLLEELDMMLNREEENEAVNRVSMHYQWLMSVYESVIENVENEGLEKEKFEEIIKMADITLENLYEGFSGMRDDIDKKGED